jgi:exodeoxyribonuclease VII large subunit
LLEGGFPRLWLEGEISNLSRPASGHLYFSLKDEQCQVRCAMFRNRNVYMAFTPQNGMQVLLRAQVSLYEGRGEFQAIIEHLEPAGDGALQLKLEQLKRKLYAEGLFDVAHKREPPILPRRIGVITSPTGAAIRDILSVLRRRFPAIDVVIYPVPVQGAGAAVAIVRSIAIADARRECDALILARGGGSLEDLWVFNEESVARAIYACGLTIVTGIGHESEFTSADRVADRRAPTPSAAAELRSPDRSELLGRIDALARRLRQLQEARLRHMRDNLAWVSRRLIHPRRRVQDLAQRLDDLAGRLHRGALACVRDKQMRFAPIAARLQQHSPVQAIALRQASCEQLGRRLNSAAFRYVGTLNARMSLLSRALHAVSPLATIERGYAIVTTLPDGSLVRDAKTLQAGDRIAVRLARGRVHSLVEEVFDAPMDPR